MTSIISPTSSTKVSLHSKSTTSTKVSLHTNKNLQLQQQAFFQENGYIEPLFLKDSLSIDRLNRAIEKTQRNSTDSKNPKFSLISEPYGDRNAHLLSKLVFDIATDSSILDSVSNCLGPNLLLWIAHIISRRSGKSGQTWHIDKINQKVGGVHASIAITDMNMNNGCLQLIPKTHQYQISQNELSQQAKLGNVNLWNAESMVELADKLHPENAPHQVVSVEMKAGQYFLTKGGIWHGVPRNFSDASRRALVARYMTTDVVGRDTNGNKLPCILVRGQDQHQLNTLYRPPHQLFKGNLLLNYRLNKLLTKLQVNK